MVGKLFRHLTDRYEKMLVIVQMFLALFYNKIDLMRSLLYETNFFILFSPSEFDALVGKCWNVAEELEFTEMVELLSKTS